MGYLTRDEREDANLTVMSDAEDHVKEYMEDGLNATLDSFQDIFDKKEFQNGIKLKVATPDFKSTSGAFMAWMIAEKGMEIDDAAAVFDSGHPDAERLASEFSLYIAQHSLCYGSDGNLYTVNDFQSGELGSLNGTIDIKAMFIKAGAKLAEYKVPDIDYTKPNEFKDYSKKLVMINNLSEEVANQNSTYGDVPYRFQAKDHDYEDKVRSAISNGKMDSPNAKYEEILKDGKAIRKQKDEIIENATNVSAFYSTLKNAYSSYGEAFTMGGILAYRALLNEMRGKTVASVKSTFPNLRQRANNMGTVIELEYELTDNRLLAKLGGESDPKLDEIIDEVHQKFDFTLKSKAKTLLNEKSKNSDLRKKYIEDQKPENIDEDFKLMGELKGEYISRRVAELLEKPDKYKISSGDQEILKELKSAVDLYIKYFDALNQKSDLKLFAKEKPIPNAYRPLISREYTEGSFESNNYFYGLMDCLSKMKTVHDTFEVGGKLNDEGGETKEEEIPEEIKELMGQVGSICDADSHFLDATKDLSYGKMCLPQAKKIYTKNNPDIKLKFLTLEETMAKKQPKTIADLDNIDKELAPKDKGKDYKILLKIDNQVNVLKYIDNIKNEVDATGKISYDQLVEVLAARAVISAKRNNKSKLDKEVSSLAIADMSDKIKDMYLIKNFYNNCVSDPKMMKDLMSSLKSGHGGAVEEMIQKHSNLVPIRRLNGDVKVLERFVTTPKERIKALQEEYAKNGGNENLFATEIMVLRNVADAARKDSSNLKRPFDAEMINEARKEMEILDKEGKMPSICSQLGADTLKDLLVRGNGGKLVEQIRRVGDSSQFGKMEGTKEILEKNTIVGKYKAINREIKACEATSGQLYKDIKAGKEKMSKSEFNNQLNEYFQELVAQSIVASDMIKEAKSTRTQRELRVDINKAEFKEKVQTLMNSEEFKKNYKTMVEPDNIPKVFTIQNVVEHYNGAAEKNRVAAEKEMAAQAKKEQNKEFKMQLEQKMNNKMIKPPQ